MKEKRNLWWPLVLMAMFALTRWPGLLPENFSAAYALAFCAGVYFPARLAWWLPLLTLLVTDVLIDAYFYFKLGVAAFQPHQLINYLAYAAIIGLGRAFRPSTAWYRLLAGGLLGAVLFYLLTNTAAWFFNPFGNLEYTRDLKGWFIALTTGTSGYPHTWEFFRNTLLSGGLFTGLFAGAMKLSEQPESEPEPEAKEEPVEGIPEPCPEDPA